MANYLDEYRKAVYSGKICAGRKIKQALKRDERDLKNKNLPYYYNNEKAEQAINFIEILPTTSGEPLKLELFQKWLIAELFGWRKKSDDTRRFSEAFISFSRKNGKSFLMSCVADLYLLVENRPKMGREILFLANSFKQAKISFDMFAHGLQHLAKESPTIRSRLKINNAEVFDKESNSHAIAMASKLQNLDGYKSDLAIIDEYALAKDNSIKDVIKTGQVNSDNALLAVISTSGNNLNSPMFHDYEFASRVLKNEVQADDLFIAIYEQDYKNEVMKSLDNSKLLEKSNPLLSNAERSRVMLPKLLNSIKLASEQDNLLPVYVKNANLWIQARSNSYIPVKDWNKAEIEPRKIDNLPVWFGVDLSKSNDLTSVSWIVPIDTTEIRYLYCDSHSWVATKWGLEEKIKKDGFNYKAGEKRKECTITDLESGVIDYDQILKYMVDLVEKHNLKVQGVMYDPWGFNPLIPDFERIGWQLIEVRQGRRTLSAPTVGFRDNIFNGKVRHPHNELLAYAVNNAVITYDSNQNPLIDKAKNQNKIDPLASLINAYVQAGDYLDNDKVIDANDYYSSDDFAF